MTREEAINHLKTVAKTAIDSGYDSAVVDAVDMAIEALEQEPKYCDRNICIQNEYNGIECDECEVTKSREPCEDAISRQAVLDKAFYTETEEGWSGYTVDVEDIKDLSSVQPQPKTGHWIKTGAEELPFGVTIPELTCSTCGWSNGLIIPRNYCPKCGAKMEEGEKNDN